MDNGLSTAPLLYAGIINRPRRIVNPRPCFCNVFLGAYGAGVSVAGDGSGAADAAGAAALVGAETDDIHGKAGEEVARLCCGIHPQRIIILLGFLSFIGLKAITLLYALSSAPSLIQHVLKTTTSADSISSISCIPSRDKTPRIFSDSCTFI